MKNKIPICGYNKYPKLKLFASSFIISWLLSGLIFNSQAQTANLGKLLHQVETNAPALKAVNSNAKIYEANRREGLGTLFGSVDAFGQLQYFNDNRLTRPISPPINFATLPFDTKQIGYGLSLTLPLDINGQISTHLNSLVHQERAAAYDAQQFRLALLNQAAALYHGIESISGKLEALNKQAYSIRKQLKVTIIAIKVGRRAPVDSLRMESELSNVEGQIADANGTNTRLRAYLSALLNQPVFSDSVAPPVKTPDEIQNSPFLKLAAMRDINNRPDIQSINEKVLAAKSGVTTSWLSFLPKAVLQGSWMENQGFNGKGKDAPFWQLGVTVDLPIWTGLTRVARIQEAEARSDAALYQSNALKASAKAEIVSAIGDWNSGKAQFIAAENSLKSAEEVERIQTEQFNQGRLSVTDYLDAEAKLAFSRASFSAALAHWWQADDSLRLAQGLAPSAYTNYSEVSK
ncbi:MAG TPA: TolC family protein [Ignavibacteriaceae bacterium]|nr:TolC family protein [Ignavibacteriaceae bacterium]